MLPERVSNPGPPTYESGALPIALRGPANSIEDVKLYETRKMLVKETDQEYDKGGKLISH